MLNKQFNSPNIILKTSHAYCKKMHACKPHPKRYPKNVEKMGWRKKVSCCIKSHNVITSFLSLYHSLLVQLLVCLSGSTQLKPFWCNICPRVFFAALGLWHEQRWLACKVYACVLACMQGVYIYTHELAYICKEY